MLLLGASLELNDTRIEGGEAFLIDGKLYNFTETREGGIVVETGDRRHIYPEDDCLNNYIQTYFCVEETSNTSATLTFYRDNHTIGLTRNAPDSINIGDTARVFLHLENPSPEDQRVTLTEETNLTVTDEDGFEQGMTWSGIINGYETLTFSYDVRATQAGEHVLNGTVRGDSNASSDDTITVEDTLGIDIEYQKNVTVGQDYNFTIELQDDANSEATVVVMPGEHVSFPRTGNFSASGNGTLHLAEDLNDSRTVEAWFTYRVSRETQTGMTILYKTVNDSGRASRTVNYELATNGFAPIEMLYAKNVTAPLNTSTDVAFQFLNPSQDTLAVTLSARGSLITDLDRTVSIAAGELYTLNFSVIPTRTDSEYAIILTATHPDPNEDEITQRVTSRITAKRGPAEQVITTNTSAAVSDEEILAGAGEQAREESNNRTRDEQEEVTIQDVQETTPLWPHLIAALLLLAGLAVWLKVHALNGSLKRTEKDLEEYLRILEGFTPRNQQDYKTKQELIRQLEQDLEEHKRLNNGQGKA